MIPVLPVLSVHLAAQNTLSRSLWLLLFEMKCHHFRVIHKVNREYSFQSVGLVVVSLKYFCKPLFKSSYFYYNFSGDEDTSLPL